MPIALISNWNSIYENQKSFLIIILLLETLLLAVFLVLDILLFYVFFESILIPLFLLIGMFGSSNKVKASFYLFLYTLLGSLFLLLAILTMSSIMGTTDYDALFKSNFSYSLQTFLFIGVVWFWKSLFFLCLQLSNTGNTLKLIIPSCNCKITNGWVNYLCKVISYKMV